MKKKKKRTKKGSSRTEGERNEGRIKLEAVHDLARVQSHPGISAFEAYPLPKEDIKDFSFKSQLSEGFWATQITAHLLMIETPTF